MHPSKSIIFFTVFTGTGYGILLCLSYLAILTDINFDNKFKLFLIITSFVFISSGLLSSTLHLGHPERAWRSFSQWKSSWLSREGLAAIITFLPLIVFYLLWYLDNFFYVYFLHSTSILCLITIYCTGQMYATLKTIPAWNNMLVTPIYTINAICMGALTVYCFTRFYEFEISYLYHLTIASLTLCLFMKLIY